MNLKATRGDTLTLSIRNTDASGIAFPIDNFKYYATLKASMDDDDTDAAATTENSDHDDAAGGVSHVTFTAEQTNDLVGRFYLDVQEKDADGNITTIASGTVTFAKDVTRRVD